MLYGLNIIWKIQKEMKILRWICGLTREDRIRNDYIRGSVGVESIVAGRNKRKYAEMVWTCYEEKWFWSSSESWYGN